MINFTGTEIVELLINKGYLTEGQELDDLTKK